MAPGTYTVRPSTGEVHFRIFNEQTGEGVFVHALAAKDPQKEWTAGASPVLQFACSDSGCALAELWTHQGYPAHGIAAPKSQEGKPTHMALIRAAVNASK